MTRLLLSAVTLRTWGKRIEAAEPSGTLSFVTAEEAVATDGQQRRRPELARRGGSRGYMIRFNAGVMGYHPSTEAR